MLRIEDAEYYTVGEYDLFSIVICGQNRVFQLRDLRSNMEDNSVRELRYIAAYLQIPHRSKFNKAELIEAIKKTNGKRRCCR